VANHRRNGNAPGVSISELVIFPGDWNRLSDAERGEYTASAATHGIALVLGPIETTNPDQLIVVTNDGTLGAPYYLGPVQCGRAHWEHNQRELLEMADPCFPNPFRDDPGSIRSFL
jgi:hypothetical protein